MPSKQRQDPRQMMERAIEIMNQSVHEPRGDGKASPRVGAVLVKPDGTVDTAYRGELRDGDHAEFTVLERKNRDKPLDGSVLFATLEPCAPGARNHPKLSCAERVVLARIRTVYVGIEDPDPTVDRKGIKYLQDNGVEVHLFDSDLQNVIRNANAQFIAQAQERAAAAEEEPQPRTVLSSLEDSIPQLSRGDFSEAALERYRVALGATDEVSSDAFVKRLIRQGLVAEGSGKPTGFGALLFSEMPRDTMPQAGLLATIEYPNDEKEICDFDGPMVDIPRALEKWLSDKLPNTIDRSQMQRRKLPTVPFEAIREAVVNALIHRDYDIRSAKCQLIVTPDKITIKSPGEPLKLITLDQLNSFTAPMLSRNPPLHFVFSRMELAEERGLGMKTLLSLPSHGLPRPRFSMDGPYLDLTIYRSAHSVAPPAVLERLTDDESRGWAFVVSQSDVNTPMYAEQLKLDERTARRHLAKFVELGLMHRTGQGRATRYVIGRNGS